MFCELTEWHCALSVIALFVLPLVVFILALCNQFRNLLHRWHRRRKISAVNPEQTTGNESEKHGNRQINIDIYTDSSDCASNLQYPQQERNNSQSILLNFEEFNFFALRRASSVHIPPPPASDSGSSQINLNTEASEDKKQKSTVSKQTMKNRKQIREKNFIEKFVRSKSSLSFPWKITREKCKSLLRNETSTPSATKPSPLIPEIVADASNCKDNTLSAHKNIFECECLFEMNRSSHCVEQHVHYGEYRGEKTMLEFAYQAALNQQQAEMEHFQPLKALEHPNLVRFIGIVSVPLMRKKSWIDETELAKVRMSDYREMNTSLDCELAEYEVRIDATHNREDEITGKIKKKNTVQSVCIINETPREKNNDEQIKSGLEDSSESEECLQQDEHSKNETIKSVSQRTDDDEDDQMLGRQHQDQSPSLGLSVDALTTPYSNEPKQTLQPSSVAHLATSLHSTPLSSNFFVWHDCEGLSLYEVIHRRQLPLFNSQLDIISAHSSRRHTNESSERENFCINRSMRLTLLLDIAKAMKFLHECGIVHGSLNLRNCYLNSRSWCVKISNFGSGLLESYRAKQAPNEKVNQQNGCARQPSPIHVARSNQFDLFYTAPEHLSEKMFFDVKNNMNIANDAHIQADGEHTQTRRQKQKSSVGCRRRRRPQCSTSGDVYSFSICIYQFVYELLPYENQLRTMSVDRIVHKLLNNQQQHSLASQSQPTQRSDETFRDTQKRNEFQNEHATQSLFRPELIPIDSEKVKTAEKSSEELNLVEYRDLIDLMQRCWQEEPAQRPTFNEIYFNISLMLGEERKNIFSSIQNNEKQKSGNRRMHLVLDMYRSWNQRLEKQNQNAKTDVLRSQNLLNRVLPVAVSRSLILGEFVPPEKFDSVTIAFSDIVGFTTLASYSSPLEVVEILNNLFTAFDSLLKHFDVYKVETIGDAYMVASGVPIRNNDHEIQIARYTLEMLATCQDFKIDHMPGFPLQIRVGIHTGPVVGGVVGTENPRYCLFGDTVNIASRLESTGQPNMIHVSRATYRALKASNCFILTNRGSIELRGRGKYPTYWLQGIKNNSTNNGDADSSLESVDGHGIMDQSIFTIMGLKQQDI